MENINKKELLGKVLEIKRKADSYKKKRVDFLCKDENTFADGRDSELSNIRQERELIFREMFLIKKGIVFVFITEGAACDSFIVRKDINKYSFGSYGIRPQNLNKWHGLGSYGGCGSYGYTKDISIVYESLCLMNTVKGRIALCTKEVMRDLIKTYGSKNLLKVNFGFR